MADRCTCCDSTRYALTWIVARGTCAQCGQVHQHCSAHIKNDGRPRSGEPCRRAAEAGSPVCRQHGANRNVRARAKQRLQAEAARAAAVEFGDPIEGDPKEILMQELWRTNGLVHWYLATIRDVVGSTVAASFTWGKVGHQVGRNSQGEVDVTTYRAAAPVLFELFDRERTKLVHVAAECVKAGVEERWVQLAEEAGVREARLLEEFARAMQVDLQSEVAQQAAERAFTVIDGGRAA